MYDVLILQTFNLTLPHPLMHQRLFVMQPLAEIASEIVHPVLNKTVAALYHELKGGAK
jgi:2-amino-4-hydroxy-6-hydroxymethyldihydropteridine diphosphokinase